MAKNRSSFSSLVYSTDPSLLKLESEENIVTPPPESQQLKVSIDKKQRAGKVVTLVTGFDGREEDLQQLGKDLKSYCGTGGSVKDGIIIIQGDNREKVFIRLLKNGYKKTVKA